MHGSSWSHVPFPFFSVLIISLVFLFSFFLNCLIKSEPSGPSSTISDYLSSSSFHLKYQIALILAPGAFRETDMDSTSSVAAVDTDIPPLQEKYDVFISFRGEDTRDAFASHLHKALLGKKIETYMDYRLEKGDDIGPALLEAIEKSKIALVIFSKDFASSTWCLKELVHILGCKKSHRQIVIPIFYRVDPSDVRKQKGTCALEDLPLKRSRDEVANWRAALEEAANISGFHYYFSKTGRTEADFVEEVVQDVLAKLNRESSSDLRGLFGIEKKIEEIESLLCLDSPGVCCVGIWGMGGIGKTTLADAVFHRLSSKFEASCFLKNVRENSKGGDGIYHLRNTLLGELLKDSFNINTPSISVHIQNRLNNTKALIVLDDVNDPSQLEFLVGYHDQFFQGSRIIITARDKGVLEHKVKNDKIYKVEELRLDEAFNLFHLHAFRNIESPPEDYIELSRKVIDYIKGIPLALKVLGSSFLRCESKEEWEDQWEKVKEFPSEKIQGVLRVSYDGLEEHEKEIFLDIACFHKDRNMNDVKGMLDIRGFKSSSGIKVLIGMSLISVSEWNSIQMHDLLQEMGRAIVRKQYIEKCSSRLFSAKDVYDVLKNNKEAARVRAIFFEKLNLNHADFDKMDELRLLIAETYNSLRLSEFFSLDLPNSLRYLDWVGYPLKSLPSNFSPENLVVLHMPLSKVGEQLWNEGQSPVNLKEIDLGYSRHLTEVPNLSKSLKIERIDLVGCERLVEIPSYFQRLQKLTYLRLAGCKNLIKDLPEMPCNVEWADLSHTALGSVKYDVFVSFRGVDTRRTFTSHLYEALHRKKIETFMDDDIELVRGVEIRSALLQALQKSTISVIIFSKNYASSPWCLDELVHILECKEKSGQLVMPIFYDISPSDVRIQQGSYALAFHQLEERFRDSIAKVHKWRDALRKAANLSGFHYSEKTESDASLLKEVVEDIWTKLNCESSSDKGPVWN